jgi:hypothetical protein
VSNRLPTEAKAGGSPRSAKPNQAFMTAVPSVDVQYPGVHDVSGTWRLSSPGWAASCATGVAASRTASSCAVDGSQAAFERSARAFCGGDDGEWEARTLALGT